RLVLGNRTLEDFREGLHPARQLAFDPRGVIGAAGLTGVHFRGDVDDAAAVDDVVRRIQDAALEQFVADVGGGQLVVGGAAHGLDLQAVQRLRVQRRAQGARGVDVGGDVIDGVRGDDLGARPGGDGLQVGLVDVGDDQLGAGLVQLLGQIGADVAHALDGDGQAGHVVLFEQAARDDQVRAEHALGRDRARVARGFRAVLQAQDVFGDLARFGDVLDRGADVFGGVVVAAQAVQIAAEGMEQLRRLLGAAVADDNRLAAAHLQVRDGVLVAHALGQAQHVFQRLGGGGDRKSTRLNSSHVKISYA